MGRSKAIRVSRAQIPANPHKIQALTHSCATHENPPSLFSTIYTLPRSTFAIDVLCSLAIANSGGRGGGGEGGTVQTRRIPDRLDRGDTSFQWQRALCLPDGFAGACGTLRSRHQSSQIPIPSGPVTAPIPLGPVTARAQCAPTKERYGTPQATLQTKPASTGIGETFRTADPNPAARHSQRARRKRTGPRKKKE